MVHQFDPTRLHLVQRSSHPDLQRISSQTLISLLDERPEDLLIIDARYPFEYHGGHIRTARNIYTDDQLNVLFSELISSRETPSKIIVFHCEFSSERGPHLCRLFRSLDRRRHVDDYPRLSFPFLYLLDGGYSEFFRNSIARRFCQPESYVSMFDQPFVNELKKHRQAKKIATGKVRLDLQSPIRFQI